MGKAVQLLHYSLLLLGAVTAQTGRVEQTIPNWLTGIIAVVVFLFLVFIAFIVNKAWCKESSQEEKVSATINEYTMTNGSNTNVDSVRSHEHCGAYEDVTFHKPEETVTVM